MIKINSESCTGCRICEIICSLHHSGVINTKRSRVRVTTKWPWEDQPNLCRQCKKPKCVEACVKKALTFTGHHPVLNDAACDGCQACAAACPFKALYIDPETCKPIPCDTCHGQYMCSKWCPNKVLEVVGR